MATSETESATDWSAIAGRTLGLLCLHAEEMRGKPLVEQWLLLERLGFPRDEAARILGTTSESLRVSTPPAEVSRFEEQAQLAEPGGGVMSSEEEVLDRLDRLVTLFKLAFSEQIETARTEIRQDATSAAILDLVGDQWMGSGDIKRAVSKSASVSEKTVQRSLATLSTQGVLRSSGSGPRLRYRSAGVL